jgi:hypothetical protein
MSNFDSTRTRLTNLLDEITDGRIQLPDFQRGWVWDDSHIRSLLVSIARDFPIGSIMLLETGGENRYQSQPVEGVKLTNHVEAERLILDGQQRLTALTQVLRSTQPVKTQDAQKRVIERFYYIDIETALLGSNRIEDAVIGVDASKTIKRNFGREIVLDLGTQEQEYERFYFPCNQILNSDQWEEGLMDYDQTKLKPYMEFRREILNRFRLYDIPIIELKKDNSKEAVCLVFEKVNTGGVPLSPFELITAIYAADGFRLRDDWFGYYKEENGKKKRVDGRKDVLAAKPLLSTVQATDFLQGISLLHTYSQRQDNLRAGSTGRDVTTVSAKRDQVLALPLDAYKRWADSLTSGFLAADKFLHMEGFRSPDYLPYRTQLTPLAAVMVQLGERWLEPVPYAKLAKWFWCGVFGELYGGAVETRIALDMQDLLNRINQPAAPEPTTVVDAGFQSSRLDTMRTRTSAAYRGLYVLLVREGCKDFFWKAKMSDLDHRENAIDIHHIFPRAWCTKNNIPDRTANSIINKTPVSYKANRMIGSQPPSKYLEQLRNHAQVQLTTVEQDEILRSHLIDPESLRADDFYRFYEQRKKDLVRIIEKEMGKTVIDVGTFEEPANGDVEEDSE